MDLATRQVIWSLDLTRDLSDGEYRTTLDATIPAYRFRIKAEGYGLGVSRTIRGEEKDASEVNKMERLKNILPFRDQRKPRTRSTISATFSESTPDQKSSVLSAGG